MDGWIVQMKHQFLDFWRKPYWDLWVGLEMLLWFGELMLLIQGEESRSKGERGFGASSQSFMPRLDRLASILFIFYSQILTQRQVQRSLFQTFIFQVERRLMCSVMNFVYFCRDSQNLLFCISFSSFSFSIPLFSCLSCLSSLSCNLQYSSLTNVRYPNSLSISLPILLSSYFPPILLVSSTISRLISSLKHRICSSCWLRLMISVKFMMADSSNLLSYRQFISSMLSIDRSFSMKSQL